MKVIKENVNSSNFLLLEGTNSVIASGPNAVGVNKDQGVFINGATSFTSTMDSVKFAGMFRFNPLSASGLPSTAITPIPTFVIESPIKGVSTISSVASILKSLV